jgi:hypothetical protein
VFRCDLDTGEVVLIGTGFWVTTQGHLVTAWHVVEENIGTTGRDHGPIFAVQTFSDRSVAVRSFHKTDKHPTFDLAMSETIPAPGSVGRPTSPIAMSLDDLRLGEPVFSFAVQAHDQEVEGESLPGATTAVFSGEVLVDSSTDSTPIKFAVRLSFGHVTHVFKEMRDRIMLPFPCIQTDVPIYGGNSGGPVFDVRGRICAVNCTSFGGNDIAFHVPIQGVLRLRAQSSSMGIDDAQRKQVSVLELAASGKILFDPPMLSADRLAYSILRWLWYAIKCICRGDRLSTNVHFAAEAEQSG